MFDESILASLSVVISVFNRFFPDKCIDDEINEIIEYMETSTDDNDVKKQNIYSMITELMYDTNGQKVICEMIEALDMYDCPTICEIKVLVSVMMVADEDEPVVFADETNEFIEDNKEETYDGELLREITEVIVHNNPTIVAEPKYKEIMKSCVREHFDAIIEDEIVDEDTFEETLNVAIETFYTQHPRECVRKTVKVTSPPANLPAKLTSLQAADQADQRTTEWYEQRHALITASSAWKVLDSQANFNSYVHSKCMPHQQYGAVNVDSPLHWGQRYEPVSVELYEHTYATKVGEFGCITHPVHKFLGASPDGINVDPTSPLYGRMLEIKNIVNREITGIPKKEYWIQMQIQMEVCDLEDCDFLECVFKEYPSSAEFEADVGVAFNKTASGAFKGVMAMFYKGSSPMYEYCPLITATSEEYDAWTEDIMERNSGILFVKYIYWRLDLVSCVYVHRNREWFAGNVGQLRHAWETIQKEKVSGFDHRKPVKKVAVKKVAAGPTINITTNIDHLDDEEEETKQSYVTYGDQSPAFINAKTSHLQ
jgi:putative phage-type endonuclease